MLKDNLSVAGPKPVVKAALAALTDRGGVPSHDKMERATSLGKSSSPCPRRFFKTGLSPEELHQGTIWR